MTGTARPAESPEPAGARPDVREAPPEALPVGNRERRWPERPWPIPRPTTEQLRGRIAPAVALAGIGLDGLSL